MNSAKLKRSMIKLTLSTHPTHLVGNCGYCFTLWGGRGRGWFLGSDVLGGLCYGPLPNSLFIVKCQKLWPICDRRYPISKLNAYNLKW